LSQGSRVQDALQAAGGALPEADVELLNLAASVEDGARVHVPVKGETQDPPLKSNEIVIPANSNAVTPGGLININSASQAELETLPGIGPELAQRIIEHRQANGLFASIEAIQDVSGIGPGKFEEIKELITVSTP
jgi:competence protein ComEA